MDSSELEGMFNFFKKCFVTRIYFESPGQSPVLWRIPLHATRSIRFWYRGFNDFPIVLKEIDWSNVGMSFLNRLMTGTTLQRLKDSNLTNIQFSRANMQFPSKHPNFKLLRKLALVPVYAYHDLDSEALSKEEKDENSKRSLYLKY